MLLSADSSYSTKLIREPQQSEIVKYWIMIHLSFLIKNHQITYLSKFDDDQDGTHDDDDDDHDGPHDDDDDDDDADDDDDDQDGPHADDWPRLCLHSPGLLCLLHLLQVSYSLAL